jgi:hypothetical protein
LGCGKPIGCDLEGGWGNVRVYNNNYFNCTYLEFQ